MNVDSPASARRSFSAVKSRERHVDLAAHLEQRRRVGDVQRDRADRAQVVRDVLADLAVAARGAALEHAVAVDEADRQAVDLGLDHERERRVADALAREVVAHPLDPRAQLLLGAHVAEREHRLEVLDLLQAPHRLAADALRGRVRACAARGARARARAARRAGGRTRRRRSRGRRARSSGGRGARAARAAPARAPPRPATAPSTRARRRSPAPSPPGARGASRAAHVAASGATGASSSSRSKRLSASRLGRSVRSKWIGVTAMRPAATAARSVPGSSW